MVVVGELMSGELVCRWPLDSFIFRGPTASEPWHSPSWTGLKLSDVQSTEKAVAVEWVKEVYEEDGEEDEDEDEDEGKEKQIVQDPKDQRSVEGNRPIRAECVGWTKWNA